MFEDTLIHWLLSIIGSGGIGAVITYFATFKTNRRKAAAEAKKEEELAEQASIESEDKLGMLERDRYEAMYNQLNKMMSDYNNLSDEFREYRQQSSERERDFIKQTNERYVQLVEMAAEIKHLRKWRCYNHLCTQRMEDDPNNIKEQ